MLLSCSLSWQVFILLYFSWKSGRSEAHEMYVSKANISLAGNTLRIRGFILSCQIKQNIFFLLRLEFPTSSMPNEWELLNLL